MAVAAAWASAGAVVGVHAVRHLPAAAEADATRVPARTELEAETDVTHQQRHLDDPEEHQAQHRSDQGGLDRDRTALVALATSEHSVTPSSGMARAGQTDLEPDKQGNCAVNG